MMRVVVSKYAEVVLVIRRAGVVCLGLACSLLQCVVLYFVLSVVVYACHGCDR